MRLPDLKNDLITVQLQSILRQNGTRLRFCRWHRVHTRTRYEREGARVLDCCLHSHAETGETSSTSSRRDSTLGLFTRFTSADQGQHHRAKRWHKVRRRHIGVRNQSQWKV